MSQTREKSLSELMREANRYPKLGPEEEFVLTRRWKESRDPKAAEELARATLRYVLAIALRYRRYPVPTTELVAEGNYGVVQALRKFEPERGYRFLTYCSYWIRAYMLDYVIRSWSLVGGGSGALNSKVFFRLRRERVRVRNLLGTGETAERELASRIGVDAEQLKRLLNRLDARDLSLEAKVNADSETRFVDLLPASDDQEALLGAHQRTRLVRKAVRGALDALDPRERYIVERRLLADAEEEVSLSAIGRTLGISRERARQLEARARKKLRAELKELGPVAGQDWVYAA